MARFLEARAVCLGKARVAGRLYDLGRYPGMLPAHTPGDLVHGELLELSDAEATLAELDRYENCDDVTQDYRPFEREIAEVILETGAKRNAWVYWYKGEIGEDRRVASGDFLNPGPGAR